MVYILEKHKRSIIALLCVYAVTVIYMVINRDQVIVSNGLSIFFAVFSVNRHLIPMLTYILLLPSFAVMDYYANYEARFDHFMIVRSSLKKYCFKSCIKVMLKSIICNLILQCMVILTIHMFFRPVSLIDMKTFELVSGNGRENLIYYMLMSNIGVGLFSAFMFVCIPLFKNRYLFRCLPVLQMFGGILVGSVVYAVALPVTLIFQTPVSRLALLNSNPLGLVTPGLMTEDNLFMSSFIAIIEYGIATGIIAVMSYRKRAEDE